MTLKPKPHSRPLTLLGFIGQRRYLENSGCVGMCVNMCKIPTQDFFTNEFGLPLTMIPSKSELTSRVDIYIIRQSQAPFCI